MFVGGVFGRTAGWIGYGLILLFIFAYAGRYFWKERGRLRMMPMDQALVDGGFGDQFPAELTIVVGNKAIGSDRGAVWFADGLMGFSGSAASLVLASNDIEVREAGRDHPRTGQPYPAGSILLRGAPCEAYVVVSPLSGHEEGYRLRLKQFQGEMASSDAERFWPPLQPYAEEASALEAAVGR